MNPYMYPIDPATGCYFPEHPRQHCPQPTQCPYHRGPFGSHDQPPSALHHHRSMAVPPMSPMSPMHAPRRPAYPPPPYPSEHYDIKPCPSLEGVHPELQMDPRLMGALQRRGSGDLSRASSCETLTGRLPGERAPRLSTGSLSTDDDDAELRARVASFSNRSTKGASKQRRDLINSEIGNLRDILPLPETARQRLSQLQIMSLACCYVRKANYFARLFGESNPNQEQPFDFSQTLTGFLLILTKEGKLLYISENITEHLGHSMVDMMTQGDSIYDIIDKRDHSVVQTQLSGGPAEAEMDEKTFFCRMNVSRSFRRQAGFGDHKVMHIRGHFIQPVLRDHYGNQPVFMALCSPLVTPDIKDSVLPNNTMAFQTVHGLDMKFTEISSTGEHHLGYTDSQLYGRSWYDFIHPEDCMEAREKHTQLIKSSRELGCMLTVRLQAASGTWVWVNIVMYLRQPFLCDNAEPAIVCLNQVITEPESPHFRLQSQLYSSHIARSPEFLATHGNGSPSHSITHVSMDTDQPQGPPTYQATIHAVPINSSPPTYPELNIGEVPRDMTSMRHDLSQATNSSPNSYDGCPSLDHKQILRADILNKLKRKMEQASQSLCKPNKMPRFNESENGHPEGGLGGGLMITGTAFVAHNSYFGGFGGSFGGSSDGGIEIMAPGADVPVFAQLGIKEEVLSHSFDIAPKAHHEAINFRPPTPPTPASSLSGSDLGDTSLTVDTKMAQATTIPTSLLTPESCASLSPGQPSWEEMSCTIPRGCPTEQTVPSAMVDLDDNSLSELDMKTPIVDQKLLRPPPPYPKEKLPELDLMSLESFLAAVETAEQKRLLNEAIEIVARASSVKADNVRSSNTTSVPSPPGSVGSPSPSHNSMMSPSPSCGSDSEADVEELERELMSMSSEQMVSTLNSILSSPPHEQELMGQFMLVPTGPTDGPGLADPAQVMSDFMDSTPRILQELNALNQLAAQSPSNGDDVLSTLSVDSSL